MVSAKFILSILFFVFFITLLQIHLIFADSQNNYQRNNVSKIINEFHDDEKYLKAKVDMGKITIFADLAITELQKQKGLAIKNSLNEEHGMLFLFQTTNKQGFWMKDMKFPIDIIWINENDKIVHIEHSLKPCETWSLFCPSYQPKSDSLYVLETVSGLSDKFSIKEGDDVYFTIIRDGGFSKTG